VGLAGELLRVHVEDARGFWSQRSNAPVGVETDHTTGEAIVKDTQKAEALKGLIRGQTIRF
jgi:hypothetical protein